MTQETPSCHLGLKQIQDGFIESVEKSPTSCEEYGRIEGVRIESVLTLFRCGGGSAIHGPVTLSHDMSFCRIRAANQIPSNL